GDGCDNDCSYTLVLDLAVGDVHNCALIEGGRVRCWGDNVAGQLGLGNTDDIGDDEPPSAAPDVALPGPAVQLAANGLSTCVVLGDGTVRCWGRNEYGQLGQGNTNNVLDPVNLPPVALGETAALVELGNSFACALLSGGSLRCWGENNFGQLGLGHVMNIGDDELPTAADPVMLGAATDSIAVGRNHSCALLTSGGLRCWGRNNAGQLGRGNILPIGDNETPASVGNLPLDFDGLEPGSGPIAVAGGFEHTCVLFSAGELACFGGNECGQLGYGHVFSLGDDEPITELATLELPAAQAVTAAFHHSCAVFDDDQIRCWGRNDRGQLGQGNTVQIGDDELPNSIGSFGLGLPITELDAGGQHTCVLLDQREVICWGMGGAGRLGYAHAEDVGDDELPADAGFIDLL
ncbi:MAG TPA: RTX toxin, partial [Enhygromyxa sp.]|nr:RTX toxin [Enhygromyxa sp.]